MKNKIYVIDWYTSRYFGIVNMPEDIKPKAGDKVVYTVTEGDGKKKLSVGTYVADSCDVEKDAVFKNVLIGEEKEFFDQQQEFALKIFPIFKKKFRKAFPGSVPVTARYHIHLDQLYFYFYSEERYIFTEFVKEFRKKIGKNIFLFQVGARDMMRVAHGADSFLCSASDQPLCCKTNIQLPSVEIENIALQNLEGRDIERLKGRCGKLKCCLVYEMALYADEVKKYPAKGKRVRCKNADTCGIVNSFNIMTGDVSVKTEEGGLVRVPVAMVEVDNEKGIMNPDGSRASSEKGIIDKSRQEVKNERRKVDKRRR